MVMSVQSLASLSPWLKFCNFVVPSREKSFTTGLLISQALSKRLTYSLSLSPALLKEGIGPSSGVEEGIII